MLLTKSNSTRPGVRKRTLNRAVKVGPLSLKFITLLVIAAGALFYLAQSTQSATKTYQQFELRDQLTQTQDKQDQLQQETIRLKSLDYIQKQLQGSDLIPVDGTKK